MPEVRELLPRDPDGHAAVQVQIQADGVGIGQVQRIRKPAMELPPGVCFQVIALDFKQAKELARLLTPEDDKIIAAEAEAERYSNEFELDARSASVVKLACRAVARL